MANKLEPTKKFWGSFAGWVGGFRVQGLVVQKPLFLPAFKVWGAFWALGFRVWAVGGVRA